MPCVGAADLPIQIGNKVFLQHVLIADIEAPFVLGYDFLFKNNCLLNIREGTLNFEDQIVQCVPESKMSSVFKISLGEATVIPANSEIITYGTFKENKPHFSTAILEPCDENLSSQGVLLAKTVVDTNSPVIPLRLANLNSVPVKLYENQTMALCDEVSVEVTSDPPKPEDIKKSVFTTKTIETEDMPLPGHLQEMYNTSVEKLSSEEAKQVKDLLIKHANVFSKSKSDLGNCGIIPHRINTGLAPPIRLPPRRVPIAIKDAVDAEVQRLIDTNLVEKSKSAWAFPLVPVRKKDGSIRICIDYRKLNEVTLPDSYPLPRVQDCLDSLQGSCWFTTLDATSGYFQLETDTADRDKTAFVCEKGLFAFRVLPMGLVNSAATYQRTLEQIMSELQHETCLIYLDDIIVYSKTFQEHIQRLDEVLTRLGNASLKLSPKKCHILQQDVTFLGHRVSSQGVATCDDKVEAVKNWPIPSCVKDLRAFLGLASYYRKFIQSFSTIAAPLNKLTEKGTNFRWSVECQTAFDTLKSVLVSAPILGYINTHDPLYLDCDCSSFAAGAVLSQLQDGKERVIAYYSKSLSRPERQYCVTRRELLAIVLAVKHFHHYLYGVSFTVRTDHGALSWLMRFKNPSGQLARWLEVLSTYRFSIQFRAGLKHGNCDGLSRINRPCSECAFCERREQEERESEVKETEICQCHEQNLENPDCGDNIGQREITQKSLRENDKMSENSFVESKEKGGVNPTEWEMQKDPSCNVNKSFGVASIEVKGGGSTAEDSISFKCENVSVSNGYVRDIHCTAGSSTDSNECDPDQEKWKQAQVDDPGISVLYNGIQHNIRPTWDEISHMDDETKTYWAQWSRLVLHNGVLCRKYFDTNTDTEFLQIVLPKSLREEILTQLHDHETAGHLGSTKTMEKVKRRFYWYNYRMSIENWCKNCVQCQSRRLPKLRPLAPMKQRRTGTPLQVVSLDLLGPFPETNENRYKYVLSICDHFTRWIELYPIRDMEAVTVAKIFVEEFVARYGLCRQILTDQGKQFESKLFKELCRLLDIDKKRCTSLHPQTNGIQERFNRTIEDMLSKYISKDQRNWDKYLPLLLLAYRSSVHESTQQTPYMMMFGRHALLPIDLTCPRSSAEKDMSESEYVQTLQGRLEVVYNSARSEMANASDRQKKTYDHRVNVVPYSEGDLVWLHDPTKTKGRCPKLQPRWVGPYKLRRKISDLVVEIEKYHDTGSKPQRKIVHVNRLKPYRQ